MQAASGCLGSSPENRRERHFAIDGLLNNVFDSRADFRSVGIKYPDLLALFEWAAGHYLEQDASPRWPDF